MRVFGFALVNQALFLNELVLDISQDMPSINYK